MGAFALGRRLPWWHRKALTQRPLFLNVIVKKYHKFTPAEDGQVFISLCNIRFNFMVSEFFGRRREQRIFTAGCGYKMAVSVTWPTAKLDGPVMPGSTRRSCNVESTTLIQRRNYVVCPVGCHTGSFVCIIRSPVITMYIYLSGHNQWLYEVLQAKWQPIWVSLKGKRWFAKI